MCNKTCKKFIGALVIVILIYLIYRLIENFDVSGSVLTRQSNEAVQNIAKIYADASGTVTFNNVSITGNFNMLPKGSIIMWNGNIAPSGWALCDGTNDTPDLRGRFVLSQNPFNGGSANNGSCDGNGYPNINTGARISSDLCNAVGINGGEAYHVLTVNEMPSHSHGYTSPTAGGRNFCYGAGCNLYLSQDNAVQTVSTGGGVSHNNIPPYYVLAFIMKL
jgi:microcystin-dependent protein